MNVRSGSLRRLWDLRARLPSWGDPLEKEKGGHRRSLQPVRCLHASLPEEAISVGDLSVLEGMQCDACPIECRIKEGNLGACKRYRNENGKLVRVTRVHPFSEVEGAVGPDPAEAIRKP